MISFRESALTVLLQLPDQARECVPALHEVLEFVEACACRRKQNDIAWLGDSAGRFHKLWVFIIMIDRDRILDFLAVRGIRAEYLTQRRIFDIGSAIPLYEN